MRRVMKRLLFSFYTSFFCSLSLISCLNAAKSSRIMQTLSLSLLYTCVHNIEKRKRKGGIKKKKQQQQKTEFH